MNDEDYEVIAGCDAAHPDQRGGQHVARQCTAVRVLHRPTGLAVTSTEHRSLHANREAAFAVLQRLLTPVLTADDREALKVLRARMNPNMPWGNARGHNMHLYNRMLAALDKVIGGGK